MRAAGGRSKRCTKRSAFALIDVAHLSILHVIKTNDGDLIRQILVETRVCDVGADLDGTPSRNERDQARIELAAAMVLALYTERGSAVQGGRQWSSLELLPRGAR